jgi:radical SAM superfamily enzyme YgiQ (UPF0313 family)
MIDAGIIRSHSFCDAICHYCDFVKHVSKGHDHNMRYLEALRKEIESYYKKYPHVDTIYIGGGTPTALSHDELIYLFESLTMYQPVEYTIEVNPESYDHQKGQLFKTYGINRVSLGVQTFHQKHLERLNRKHTNTMVFETIASLKSLDIHNINVDLIYALEHQTVEDLHQDIDTIIKLDIPHVSAYSLIIEEKTFFSHQLKRNKFIKQMKIPKQPCMISSWIGLKKLVMITMKFQILLKITRHHFTTHYIGHCKIILALDLVHTDLLIKKEHIITKQCQNIFWIHLKSPLIKMK